MPVPVKPKEQQPLTTHACGAQKSTVSIKHGKSYKELEPVKLKQQHAKVQPMVTRSVSQQGIPNKISRKGPISYDQSVITRSEIHNVPKQLVTASSKSARINEKQYSLEFPVSYKLIASYTGFFYLVYIRRLLKMQQKFHKKK